MNKSLFFYLFLSNSFIYGQQLRWGIIATSRFAQLGMIKTIQESPRSHVVAIASRDIKKAERVAANCGIEKAYGAYDELIHDKNVDVVYINLPNSLHAPWTIKALLAGKHVFCEKPLALSVKEVEKIITLSQEKNRVVIEGFQHMYHPQTHKILELVHSDILGAIRLIKSSFSLTTRMNEGNIRMHKELGGGALWDKGGYQLSLAYMIMKCLPESVYAQQLIHNEFGIDVVTTGTLKFGNVLAQFDIGIELPFRESVEIVGTKARLIINDPWRPGRNGKPSIIQISDSVNADQYIKIEPGNPYKYEIQETEALVLDGKRSLCSLELSKNVAIILEALHRSGNENRVITVKK